MNESSNRLPDLYQHLGLVGLENDSRKIAAAIKQAASQAQQSSGTEQSRAQKVVALAEKYLLDPARKQAYDQQWKVVYQPTAAAAASPAVARTARVQADQPEWDMTQLTASLPGGDPAAPFNMAAYLGQSQARDPALAEAELQRLLALLSQESSADAAPVVAVAIPAKGTDQDATAGVPSTNRHLPRQAQGRHAHAGSFANRLRQKQQRTLLWGGIGLGTGVIALIGLALFLMREPKLPPAERPKRPASGSNSLAMAQQGKTELPEGSSSNLGGLPQPGEQPQEILAAPFSPATSGEMPAPAAGSPAPAPAAMPPQASSPPPETTLPASSQPPEKPPIAPPAMPESMPPPAKPPASDTPLTVADKEAWQKGMLAARELIAQQDFDEADKQLSSLAAIAKTAVQREQLERLTQVNGFVKETQQAVVQAILGLSAAETFQIGSSTQASFVEGDAEQVTVKVAGQTRTFKLKEIPLAMSLALVDLKLDVMAAPSKARKGAFVLMHPKNKTMLERGKQWMLEAAAAGAITKELAQFYSDDYSLP